MARYTKKDNEGCYYIELAGEKHYTDVWGHLYGEAINRFAELENAYVVPKSEVEKLQSDNSSLQRTIVKLTTEIEILNEKNAGLALACMYDCMANEDCLGHNEWKAIKSEVAREIFEEISKASAEWGCYCITTSKSGFLTDDVNRTLAELKKKYTGGQMMGVCKHYDKEFNCCKLLSDWSDPMPVLQPCVKGPCKYFEEDFKFDYGVVVYKHRFSINRSLDDYEETTLSKCIRMGVQYKYKTMAKDKLIAEMQILYKDENDKLHCLCEDLHEYTFEIKHKGNMQIAL